MQGHGVANVKEVFIIGCRVGIGVFRGEIRAGMFDLTIPLSPRIILSKSSY